MRASRARPEMKASRARPEMKQDAFLRSKPRSRVPHEFVLDALEPAGPVTKPMFGCLAVYVRERIVLILRDHRDHPADNGVWLATTPSITIACAASSPTCGRFDSLGRR